MSDTLDGMNLPRLKAVSADTPKAELQAALAESMRLYQAALNTRTRGGQPLDDLAGSYLSRAGAIQMFLLNT
jgi:hypothetical protein